MQWEGSRMFISQKSKVAQLGCQALLQEPCAKRVRSATNQPRAPPALTWTSESLLESGSAGVRAQLLQLAYHVPRSGIARSI
jgi:hypothetical protein